MKRYSKVALLLLGAGIGAYYLFSNSFPSTLVYVRDNLAAVFFFDKVTVATLQQKYAATYPDQKKIKIVIVPGHEPDYGGTLYKNLKERDMNVALADKLASELEADPHFDITQSRDEQTWNPELSRYFSDHWEDIKIWMKQQKLIMQTLIDNNNIELAGQNPHASASPDVAVRLYGINRWAGDNDVDIIIHVHFNDYGSRKAGKAGRYSGLVIYVPERQYSNSLASRKIAESIFKELNKEYATSTSPIESSGVIEDQDLIAIGSHNTSDTASMLIEYGYIYEPQFATESSREKVFTDMAERTYRGLNNFFNAL